jgi:hypothetical protein
MSAPGVTTCMKIVIPIKNDKRDVPACCVSSVHKSLNIVSILYDITDIKLCVVIENILNSVTFHSLTLNAYGHDSKAYVLASRLLNRY